MHVHVECLLLGFKRLFNIVAPKYEIPSRKYFTETVVPDMFRKCKTRILQKTTAATWISLTSDMWTSEVNSKSFISLTAHWVTDDFSLEHAVLCVRFFPGSHTGEKICEIISQVLDEYEINITKVHLFLRDSGANIKKAAKLLTVDHEACFIHSLQLVILDSIKCQRNVLDLIATGRKIVTHLNHSSSARAKLERIQEEINLPKHRLVQDVQTRWNSTFYLIERLCEQKMAVNLLAAETETDSVRSLTQNQWQLAESLLRVLKPFEEITREFSSVHSIISDVIPTLSALKKYISQCGVYGLGTLKDTLLSNLNTRFFTTENKFLSVLDNPHFYLATFLDPRYKSAFFEEQTKANVENDILKILVGDLEVHQSNADADERATTTVMEFDEDEDDFPLIERASTSRSTERDASDLRVNSVFQIISEIASTSSVSTSSQNVRDTEKEMENEIKMYLSLTLLARNACPFLWWKQNKTNFPHLAKLTAKYLSPPATTIFSERLFSEAGNVFEAHRNRLLETSGEQLIYLHHNLPLLNFDY